MAPLIEIHGADAFVTAQTRERQTATLIRIVRIQLKHIQPWTGHAHENDLDVYRTRDLHHEIVSRTLAPTLRKSYDHTRVAGVH